MLDMLDTLIVREFVASLPPRERTVAELLMFGHSQASAARALRITGRMVRHHMQTIRRGFSFDFPPSGLRQAPFDRLTARACRGQAALSLSKGGSDAAAGLDNTHDR